MEQADLHSVSGRCELNADTFSKLLVIYDANANNLKVTIKQSKKLPSLVKRKKRR